MEHQQQQQFQDVVNQHIEHTMYWHHRTDNNLANVIDMLKQDQAETLAYLHSQGRDPDPGQRASLGEEPPEGNMYLTAFFLSHIKQI
jgi:hypothetical protein